MTSRPWTDAIRKPLLNAYQHLVDQHRVDTMILIDGSTNSLMRSDEASLGTPKDAVRLAAVEQFQGVSQKLLICLGFGVDPFHGVAHAPYLAPNIWRQWRP
jgi:hypothetical protein